MNIERVANGFIVSVPNDLDDGYIQTVFQMQDIPKHVNRVSDGEDLDTWRKLLYFIMEQMGYYPSYNDEKLIQVRILKSDDGIEVD